MRSPSLLSIAVGLAGALVLLVLSVSSAAAPVNIVCPNGVGDIRAGIGVGTINVGMTILAVAKSTHVWFDVANGFVNSRHEPITADGQLVPITPETALMRSPDPLSAPTLRGVTVYTQGAAIVYITLTDFDVLGSLSRTPPPLPPIATCATDTSLHLGSAEEDVLARYGTGVSTGDLLGFHYVASDTAGILFGFDTLSAAARQQPRSVNLIGVFKPGTLCHTLEVAAAATHMVPRLDCSRFTPHA